MACASSSDRTKPPMAPGGHGETAGMAKRQWRNGNYLTQRCEGAKAQRTAHELDRGYNSALPLLLQNILVGVAADQLIAPRHLARADDPYVLGLCVFAPLRQAVRSSIAPRSLEDAGE